MDHCQHNSSSCATHLPMSDIYQHTVCSIVPFPVLPTVIVSTVQSTSDYPAGSNISLVCSWNTSVYYVAWYKDGDLLYDEDLAAPYVRIAPPQGICIASDFSLMMSTLIIDNAAWDDSGNYTCAVTCRARGIEDTIEVFVYGKCMRFQISHSSCASQLTKG